MAAVTDYSQSGEQEAILELAAGLPVGRFLDIGAADGVTFSNTRALAEAGWGGVAVEPAAWAFDKLAEVYADGGVDCVCAVVTGRLEGLQTFLYARNDLISTTVPAEAAKWPDVPFMLVFAASVPLHTLLDDLCGGVTVVSIDAEGRTDELVRSYRQHAQWGEVRVLCHEHVGAEHTLRRLLLRDGFDLMAATANNMIWWRP